MSSDPGTSEATAVTRRQQLGAYLTLAAFFFLFPVTFGAWVSLISLAEDKIDAIVTIAAWAYAHKPNDSGMWYSIPPVEVVAAGFVGGLAASTVIVNLRIAIHHARGNRTVLRRTLEGTLGVTAETENLKQQLRQRGRTGLFARRFKVVRVGLPILAAVVVLATVLLYPRTATDTSGAVYEVHWGLPMWVSAVSSVAAIFGCLLMLPFRPEDDVVVDGSGNVHAQTERVVQPPHLPQPHAPASV